MPVLDVFRGMFVHRWMAFGLNHREALFMVWALPQAGSPGEREGVAPAMESTMTMARSGVPSPRVPNFSQQLNLK